MAKTDKMKKALNEFSKATAKLAKLNAEAVKLTGVAMKMGDEARAAAAKAIDGSKSDEERSFWQGVADGITVTEMPLSGTGSKVASSFAKSVDKGLKAAMKLAEVRIADEKKAAAQAKKDEADKKAAEKKVAAAQKKAEAKAAKEAAKAEKQVEASDSKQVNLDEAIDATKAAESVTVSIPTA